MIGAVIATAASGIWCAYWVARLIIAKARAEQALALLAATIGAALVCAGGAVALNNPALLDIALAAAVSALIVAMAAGRAVMSGSAR